MELSKKTGKSTVRTADAFEHIALTDYERAVAKARMAQAETIADGLVSVFNGITAALAATGNGLSALARRVRTAFMKPAHH